jgi:hypothetical protein
VRTRLGVAVRLAALVFFIQHVTRLFFSCVLALWYFYFTYLSGAKTFTKIGMLQGNMIMITFRNRFLAKGRRKDAAFPLLPISDVLVDGLGVIVVNSGLSSNGSRSVIRHAIIL